MTHDTHPSPTTRKRRRERVAFIIGLLILLTVLRTATLGNGGDASIVPSPGSAERAVLLTQAEQLRAEVQKYAATYLEARWALVQGVIAEVWGAVFPVMLLIGGPGSVSVLLYGLYSRIEAYRVQTGLRTPAPRLPMEVLETAMESTPSSPPVLEWQGDRLMAIHPRTNADDLYAKVSRLLRAAMQAQGEHGGRARQIPPATKLPGWTYRAWHECITTLGDLVVSRPGAGTYCAGDYTLGDLYVSIARRDIALPHTNPDLAGQTNAQR